MKPTSSNRKNLVVAVIAFVFAGLITSCSDEDEKSVNPNERVPFIGSYQVKDQNSEESQYFSFTLQVKESSKGPDKVELKNFRYINSGLVGTIQGNRLFISQVFEDSDEKVEVDGEGTLTGDKLVYNYKVTLNKKGQDTRYFENTAEATKVE